MATEIDKIIVQIQGDISGLKKSLASMERVTKKGADDTKRHLQGINDRMKSIGTAAKAAGVAIATAFAANAFKGMVQLGVEAETSKRRLATLFNSARDADTAFKIMEDAASSTGFALSDMQRVSGSLAVAVGGDVSKLEGVLKTVMNIAEAGGLSLQDAASNYTRAVSAGIGAADLFRESGVKSMAGFQEGVSYSTEETVKILNDAFGSGGRFGTVADDMAGTLGNLLSNVGDEYEKFQRAIMDAGVSDALKRLAETMIEVFEANGDLVDDIADGLVTAINAASKAIRFLSDNFDTIIMIIKGLIGAKLAIWFVGVSTAIAGVVAASRTYMATLAATVAAQNAAALSAGGLTKALRIVKVAMAAIGPGKFIKAGAAVVGFGAAILGFKKNTDEASDSSEDLNADLAQIEAEMAAAAKSTDTFGASTSGAKKEVSDLQKELNDLGKDLDDARDLLYDATLGTSDLNEELNAALRSAGLSPFDAYIDGVGDIETASIGATAQARMLAQTFLQLKKAEKQLELRKLAEDVLEYANAAADGSMDTEDYDDALVDLKDALYAGAISQSEFNDVLSALDARMAASEVEQLSQAIEKVQGRTKEALVEQKGYNKEFAKYVVELGKDPTKIFIDEQGKLNNVTGENSEQFETLASTVQGYQDTVSDTKAQQAASKEMEEMSDQIDVMKQRLRGVEEPLTDVQKSIDGYAEKVKYLQDAEENLQAVEFAGTLQKEYEKTDQLNTAQNELRSAIALATGDYDSFTASLQEAGIKAVINREEFEALRGEYDNNIEAIENMQDELQLLELATKAPYAAGIVQGMRDFYSESSDLTESMASVTKSAFSELTGALSDFFMTGKMDFKGFVNVIKRGLADVAAKAIISTGINFLDAAFPNISLKKDGGIIGKYANGGFIGGFDAGGPVGGVGGPRDDANLALLSRGEYVINARSTKLFGKNFFDKLNAGIVPKMEQAVGSANLSMPAMQNAISTLDKPDKELLGSFGLGMDGFSQSRAQSDGKQTLPKQMVEDAVPKFFLGGLVKAIKKAVKSVVDFVKDVFDGLMDGLKKVFGFVKDSVKKIINGILNGDLGTILALASTFILPGVGAGIMGAFGKSFALGGGGFSSLIGNVGGAISTSFANGLLGASGNSALLSIGKKLMVDTAKDILTDKLADWISGKVFNLNSEAGSFRGGMDTAGQKLIATAAPYTADASTYAAGGFVSGAGTSTSDSIPARLSNGEYVIRASAVRKLGIPALDAINKGSSFAGGGLVGNSLTSAVQRLSTSFYGDAGENRNEKMIIVGLKDLSEVSSENAMELRTLTEALEELTEGQDKQAVAALERQETLTKLHIAFDDLVFELRKYFGIVDEKLERLAEIPEASIEGASRAAAQMTSEGGGFSNSGVLELGNNSVIVNQALYLTAGVAGQVKAEVQNLMPQFKTQVLSAIVQAKRNGYVL